MKRSIAIAIALFLVILPLSADRFAFLYQKDGKYHLLTTVNEEVYINRVFSHRALILDRIAFTVSETKNGAGYLKAEFQTSEESVGTGNQVFSVSDEYSSEFWRDQFGAYTIAPQYYMPIARNVPLFPDKDLKVGDSWTMPGEEVHDFRRNFGIDAPYHIPFVAKYQYLGKEERDGRKCDVFTVSYSLFIEPKKPTTYRIAYPIALMAYSDQKLLWDSTIGQPYVYQENFKFIFEMSNGVTIEYRGTSEGKMIQAPLMNKEDISAKVQEDIRSLGITDTNVRKDDLGVTLTLQNIQFLPDSAVLRDSEKEKLNKIAEILIKYPERDILITGHTAVGDTPAESQELSEQRARAVAEYLISIGVRTKEHIIIKGMGESQPVADNATFEGRVKNRRVEITILEN